MSIVNQDFGLMDEVHTWAKDLHILIIIKGQSYRTLMEVYTIEELDKIQDWIEKITAGNKVMEGLHEYIQKLKDQTQENILEVVKCYDVAALEIFEDESKIKLKSMQTVVKQF